MMQETARFGFDDDDIALAPHVEPVERLERALCLAVNRTEGREIVMADQRLRRAAEQAGYAAIFMALLVAGILFPIASFAVASSAVRVMRRSIQRELGMIEPTSFGRSRKPRRKAIGWSGWGISGWAALLSRRSRLRAPGACVGLGRRLEDGRSGLASGNRGLLG